MNVRKSALLPFSSEQVFDLVNDVARYPEFVRGCVGTRIHSQDAAALEATLQLRRGGMDLNLRTRNALRRPESIVMVLVDGPVRSLVAEWRFTSLGDRGCKIEFSAAVTFASVLQRALEPLLQSLMDELVGAFIARARALYGN